jgi:hypothetical protein
MQNKICPFETETEVKKWHSRLMNNPDQFEKEAFVDRINEINFAIKEFRKLYEKAPVTDHLFRTKIITEIERSKNTLAKIGAEYDMFKKYKRRQKLQ